MLENKKSTAKTGHFEKRPSLLKLGRISIDLCANLLKMATLEASIARTSFLTMVGLSIFLAFLALMVWIGLMAILAILLISAGWGLFKVILAMLAIHSVVMLVLVCILASHRSKISFPLTRRQIQRLKRG